MFHFCYIIVNRYPILRTCLGTLRLIQKSDLPGEAKKTDVASLANELIAVDLEDKEVATPKATKQDKKGKRPAHTPPTSAEKLEARKRLNSL